MANKLYPLAKKQMLLQAGIDLSSVNVRALLVDTGRRTPTTTPTIS